MRAPESPAALTDGAWATRRLVQVWQQEPAFDVRVRSLIACPTCRATIAVPCPHAERLVSRRCPCGEVPAYDDGYCSSEHRDKAATEIALRRRAAA